MPTTKKSVLEKKELTANIYNAQGEIVGVQTLANGIFGIPLKEGLVHLAVVQEQAAKRKGTASTKTKGEVRGGGKKPWKQKGTGRARHGSIRSPLWRGGGIVFGPRPDRNYSLKMNKKAKRKALLMVLSQTAQNGNIILLDTLSFQAPKTKEANVLLQKLPLGFDAKKKKRIGFVATKEDSVVRKSLRNIPLVKVVSLESMNIVDTLSCSKLVIPLSNLKKMEEQFSR